MTRFEMGDTVVNMTILSPIYQIGGKLKWLKILM